MRRRWLILFVLVPLGCLAFIAIGGLLVQLLWNWLLPTIFGWREVTFWQALGLLALCRILFGGLAIRGSARGSHRGRMAERWRQMTPEERERLRQRMGERWGFGPPASESKGP